MAVSFRSRIYSALDSDPTKDSRSWVTVALVALIMLNVAAVILDTVESVHEKYGAHLGLFEGVSLGIFSVEYLLRLWSIREDPRYARPILGRLRYAFTPMALIDLAAIIPSYLFLATALGGMDLRFLRALRFFRLFRVLKLGRYSPAVHTLGAVFRDQRAELSVAVGAVGILLIVSSSVMYIVEHDAQPEKFSSIPQSMWWAIITLTTIGYGDVYPVTTAGKVAGGVTALLGVAIVALPTAILGAGFIERIRKGRKANQRCAHCGKLVTAREPDASGSVAVEVAGPRT